MNNEQQHEMLKPCAHCGGEAHISKGHAVENVWTHGTFYRVFCGNCQIRQLFHATEGEAIAAWNRRALSQDDKPSNEAMSAQPVIDKCNAVPEYETKFQREITELVMRHIDRMNDICEEDTADNIINDFTQKFDPIFQTYMDAKFTNCRKFAAAPQPKEGEA